MPAVIAWCGFLGAWLLVAGPVFQAATELQAEEFDRESVAATARVVGPQPKMSPWWWLLPPVAYLRQRRSRRVYQDAVFAAMDSQQVEQFVSFSNVATGWLTVGLGAFFIGVKETWELHEVYKWPVWVFAVLVVVALAAALGNTVLRLRRSHDMLDRKHAEGTAS